MTINTQVNRDNGTKSTNTMWGQEFKGNFSEKAYKSSRRAVSQAQQEKTQAARRELVALTKHLKQVQQEQAERYCSESKAAEILAKSPNDLLREHYLTSTGASELKTFHQWKNAGYSVKKGETALRVWGKPFKANAEKVVSTPDGEHTVAVSYDRYPMVPLYSDLQVQSIQNCETGAGAVNDDKQQAENSSCSDVAIKEFADKQQTDSISECEGAQAHETINLPAVIDTEVNNLDSIEVLEADRLNGDTECLVSAGSSLNAQSNEIIVSDLNDSDSAKPFVNTRKTTAKMVAEIKACDEDFEWYPTTDEIIQAVNSDIDSDDMPNVDSILDCGAGDGRVLEKLSAYRKYAIEKSKPLLDAMSKDIFVVGTDFAEQVLIDKKVDVVFSNPPYSEYEKWVIKIITQANAKYVYLVIPDRWKKVKAIQDSLDSRGAEAQVMGEFDFLNAERKARARVHLVRVDLCYSNRYCSGLKVDPFELWFAENFKLEIDNDEQSKYDIFNQCKEQVDESVNKALVNGSDLITALESLYQYELQKLLGIYKKLEMIDPVVLDELNVSLTAVKRALRIKIEGLKDIFWKELFNRLDKITCRLTKASRERLLSKLTEHTHVDFTASNAYAVVVWVIKNANHYFDDQLISMVETMTNEANIENYASNQRTFDREEWQYGRTPSELARYKLDYRIVLHRSGGISMQSKSGLSPRAGDVLNDLRTIATNLGFDASHFGGAHSCEWVSNRKNTFLYHAPSTVQDHILFEAKAYKNGNMHLKLNQAFICRLNVEFGRLKGWLKSSKQAAEELAISEAEAAKSFASNLQLEQSNVLALTFQNAA